MTEHVDEPPFPTAPAPGAADGEQDSLEPGFKDSVFLFEVETVPEELRVVDAIAALFRDTPEGATTLIQIAHTLDEAAVMIDGYKERTCGSAYNLAVVNLNMFASVQEIEFLLKPDVLGDPRTVFLSSIRHVPAELYAYAKAKVEREMAEFESAPSSIHPYGPSTRDELCNRASDLIRAYLQEAEARLQAKRSGILLAESPARELLRKFGTTCYRKRRD